MEGEKWRKRARNEINLDEIRREWTRCDGSGLVHATGVLWTWVEGSLLCVGWKRTMHGQCLWRGKGKCVCDSVSRKKRGGGAKRGYISLSTLEIPEVPTLFYIISVLKRMVCDIISTLIFRVWPSNNFSDVWQRWQEEVLSFTCNWFPPNSSMEFSLYVQLFKENLDIPDSFWQCEATGPLLDSTTCTCGEV